MLPQLGDTHGPSCKPRIALASRTFFTVYSQPPKERSSLVPGWRAPLYLLSHFLLWNFFFKKKSTAEGRRAEALRSLEKHTQRSCSQLQEVEPSARCGISLAPSAGNKEAGREDVRL